MFLDCPAYLDAHGARRCGLPAEIQHRYTVGSTDGPLESAKIQCPRGHWFNGPLESLTWDEGRRQTAAGPERETARDRAGRRAAAIPPGYGDEYQDRGPSAEA